MTTVNPYQTSLNRHTAYWMAKIAQLSYVSKDNNDKEPDENAILEALQEKDSKFIRVTGASSKSSQAILVEHEDYFCAAFRGTDEWRDWLDNINIFPKKELFGEFHVGFYKALEDIWRSEYIQEYQNAPLPKKPILLTGHSLGGAMATIAAARLLNLDLPFTSVYTFGQPRTMTLATARIFNVQAKDRFFRFQNNNDIVTRVPSRLMNFSHVGTFIYISHQGKLFLDSGLWMRFLNSVGGAVENMSIALTNRNIKLDSIQDHSMGEYLKAIEKWDLVKSPSVFDS